MSDDHTRDGADHDEGSESAADDDYVDELPEDLDASEFVGPYLFPNNSRRRIPGLLYLAIGASVVAWWAVGDRDGDPWLNGGVALAGVGLILLGAYHLQAGWDLAVDEQDALVAATRAVGFPVGHASAQMAWRGLRSRPTWRILLYSNETPPHLRGFVQVDGVDGEVLAQIVEENPEDWSTFESPA